MSENTKHELDSRLEVAFLYLKRFCEESGAVLKRKFVGMPSGEIVIVCGSSNGTHASIGIDKTDRLRIFMEDKRIQRWAMLEGFSEDEMYEKLENEVIKEATLLELARALIA